MANVSSSKRPRNPLVLPGNARNQNARKKELEDAERSLRTITEIGITRDLLIDCVNQLGLYSRVEGVLGLPYDSSLSREQRRMRLINALQRDSASPPVAQDTVTQDGARATDVLAAQPKLGVTLDALAQATAIARSSNGEIDWTREPLTEMERKIRQRWLERRLSDPCGCAVITSKAGVVRLGSSYLAGHGYDKIPSDLQAAVERAQKIIDEDDAQYERDEIADIMDEIDDDESD